MSFIIHVSSFIVNNNDKFLMVQEKKEASYKKFNFPGGHLENNEEIIQGAIREAKEEVGISIYPNRLLKIFDIIKDNNHFIHFIFLVTKYDGKVLANPNEVLACKWFNVEEYKNSKSDFLHPSKIDSCIDAWLEKKFTDNSIIKKID